MNVARRAALLLVVPPGGAAAADRPARIGAPCQSAGPAMPPFATETEAHRWHDALRAWDQDCCRRFQQRCPASPAAPDRPSSSDPGGSPLAPPAR